MYTLYQYQFLIFHVKFILIESWITYYLSALTENDINLIERPVYYLLSFDILLSIFMIKGVSINLVIYCYL
jgi:hypothetical protein